MRNFFKKIDIYVQMRYNVIMKKINVIIVGGGASGLTVATALANDNYIINVFERGDRVGRKLSATGNGQGNVTNLAAETTPYFSFSKAGKQAASDLVARFDHTMLMQDLQSLGLLLTTDERGRVYPAGRQASAVTDALRFTLAEQGVCVHTCACVESIKKDGSEFCVRVRDKENHTSLFRADVVVLCAGGNVAKQFGTDGSAYALATALGHTLTPLYPSLVQLKTDTVYTKTLKGIRVADAKLSAAWQDERGNNQTLTLQGDVIFTDYGVSGDAVFRVSAYVAASLTRGVTLTIDFLPDYDETEIYRLLLEKQTRYPSMAVGELLCGFVNNQIARAVMKRAENDLLAAAKLVKAFSLSVKGSMGADMAQVTKGGVCMDEVDETLQSKRVEGLYFAGEMLDVDGPCGGFNLQWAYASAKTVAAAIKVKYPKGRGQV